MCGNSAYLQKVFKYASFPHSFFVLCTWSTIEPQTTSNMQLKNSKIPKIDVHHHVYPQIMRQGITTFSTCHPYISRQSRDPNNIFQLSRKQVETRLDGIHLPGANRQTATFQQASGTKPPFSLSPLLERASKKTLPKQLN